MLFFLIKLFKMLFYTSLMMSTMLAISSFSWFSMWMGLEINLLSMLPLMNSSKNLYPSEAAMKYFLTQTIASSFILVSIMINLNLLEFLPQNSNLFLSIMFTSGLLMKMGAAPFHFWLPEVMEGLNWTLCFVIMTWQKIAPMVILMNSLKLTLFMAIIIVYTSLISGIQGMNQVSMRKILAFSSINHVSWMLSSMLFSNSLWVFYFVSYSIINLNLILVFNKLNIWYLKQMFNSASHEKLMKFLFSLNFLSLGGLPPFLGFMPKWLTIGFLVENNFFIVTTMLIIFTLFTLFYYMRVASNSMVIYSHEILSKSFFIENEIISFNFMALSSLLLCTFVLNL